MTSKCARSLLPLAFAVIFSVSSLQAKEDTIDLKPGEGLLVFKMETNFVNTPFGKFQVLLKKKNTLDGVTVVPKQKDQWTKVAVPIGEYELVEFSSPNWSSEFYENNTVLIEEGATTYIGDITFIAKNRPLKTSPLVETFEVNDNSDEAREALEDRYTENFRTALVLTGETPTDLEADKAKLERFFPVKKQYNGENLESKGLVVARIAMEKSNVLMHAAMLGMSRPIITSFSLDFEPTDGSKQIGFIRNDALNLVSPFKPLDKQTKGLLVAIEVPPGTYNINRFDANVSYMTVDTWYFNTIDSEAPFSVNAGEITYIGEIFAHALKERFLLFNSPQNVEFYITNQWERDQKELYSKFKFLKDFPVTHSLLEGQNGWEAVFHTGENPRDMLTAQRKNKSK